jgi:hypothetical protein
LVRGAHGHDEVVLRGGRDVADGEDWVRRGLQIEEIEILTISLRSGTRILTVGASPFTLLLKPMIFLPSAVILRSWSLLGSPELLQKSFTV